MSEGKVFLVGAGPGDPKLITVRGLELLRRADVVVHDRLASPRLLREAKPEAKLIYCGKDSSKHTLTQEQINQVIVKEAKEGNLVVRLKGGDPCIFGRVGEEAEECAKHHIPFEIVPGITSGIAAPAYAGIPLTHRDYNSSVAIVTGHRCTKNEAQEIDWEKISGMDTIVIYMGVKNLPYICEQLVRYGKDPKTPVALVRWGTTGEQQTLVGEIEGIGAQVKKHQFESPAIIVVGDVVKLREHLNWYESKVLFGKKVAYLHDPIHLDDTKIEQLVNWGAEVAALPVCEINPVDEPKWSDLAMQLDSFDRIVLANETEAQFFFQFLRNQRVDIRKVQAELVTIGQKTAELVDKRGIIPTLVDGSLDYSQLTPYKKTLVLNQAGSGVIKEESLAGSTIWFTSFYQRKYDWEAVRQLLVREKIDLVICEEHHGYLNHIEDTSTVVLSNPQLWSEESIKKVIDKKILV